MNDVLVVCCWVFYFVFGMLCLILYKYIVLGVGEWVGIWMIGLIMNF